MPDFKLHSYFKYLSLILNFLAPDSWFSIFIGSPFPEHKIWNITNHGYWSWALTFYTLVAKHAFMLLEEIDFECVPWLIRHEHKVVGSRRWHGETAGLAFEVAASGVSAGAVLPGISQASPYQSNLFRSHLPGEGCFLINIKSSVLSL